MTVSYVETPTTKRKNLTSFISELEKRLILLKVRMQVIWNLILPKIKQPKENYLKIKILRNKNCSL